VKNKKLMYALLLASALVWGWVFIKIFNVIFKSEEAPLLSENKKLSIGVFEKKDTFQLLVNYKDPFLKTKSRQLTAGYNYSSGLSVATHAHLRAKKSSVEIIKEEKTIDWSFIKYKGRITRQSTGKVVSLINIGGGDYSLEDGKEMQQVMLLKSYPDSIWVKFDGVKKYIKRNQN
jgi:hypothetical protein